MCLAPAQLTKPGSSRRLPQQIRSSSSSAARPGTAGPVQPAGSSLDCQPHTHQDAPQRWRRVSPACWCCQSPGAHPHRRAPARHTGEGKQHRHLLRGSLKNYPRVTQAWISNSSSRHFHTEANTLQARRVYSRCECWSKPSTERVRNPALGLEHCRV